MASHSKLEPCELAHELAELLQRMFTEPPPELFEVFQQRPIPSELRGKVELAIAQIKPAVHHPQEVVDMALRSIQRTWDKFHDGSVTPNEFLRTPFDVPYEIVSINGRGRGIIASRDITAGEVIMQESPVLMFPLTDIRFFLLLTLPQKALEAIFFLHNQRFDQRKFSIDTVPSLFCVVEILAGILDTNTFGQISSTGFIGLLLLAGSMFNHSDRSNVGRAWDDGTERMVFTSRVDIKEGDELVLDYAEGASDSVRAEHLKAYGIL
ncbi:hypothetical protein VTL71DRAFT_12034 [Oculimacula yallundae]|uniref:SET domain-containing protein n=1 Tax=Oculimacula yallundae TaxID=86028 RepID=A0ABR4CU62_9HELO